MPKLENYDGTEDWDEHIEHLGHARISSYYERKEMEFFRPNP